MHTPQRTSIMSRTLAHFASPRVFLFGVFQFVQGYQFAFFTCTPNHNRTLIFTHSFNTRERELMLAQTSAHAAHRRLDVTQHTQIHTGTHARTGACTRPPELLRPGESIPDPEVQLPTSSARDIPRVFQCPLPGLCYVPGQSPEQTGQSPLAPNSLTHCINLPSHLEPTPLSHHCPPHLLPL